MYKRVDVLPPGMAVDGVFVRIAEDRQLYTQTGQRYTAATQYLIYEPPAAVIHLESLEGTEGLSDNDLLDKAIAYADSGQRANTIQFGHREYVFTRPIQANILLRGTLDRVRTAKLSQIGKVGTILTFALQDPSQNAIELFPTDGNRLRLGGGLEGFIINVQLPVDTVVHGFKLNHCTFSNLMFYSAGLDKTYANNVFKVVREGQDDTYGTGFADILIQWFRAASGMELSLKSGNTPFENVHISKCDVGVRLWQGTLDCAGLVVQNCGIPIVTEPAQFLPEARIEGRKIYTENNATGVVNTYSADITNSKIGPGGPGLTVWKQEGPGTLRFTSCEFRESTLWEISEDVTAIHFENCASITPLVEVEGLQHVKDRLYIKGNTNRDRSVRFADWSPKDAKE